MRLTLEKANQYIRSDGGHCPFCGGNLMSVGDYEHDVDGPSCIVTCDKCERRWRDIYRLTAVASIKEK